MKVIKRSKETGTRFKLISGKELYLNKIIQIVVPQVYENKGGYAVYLCEVEKESEE